MKYILTILALIIAVSVYAEKKSQRNHNADPAKTTTENYDPKLHSPAAEGDVNSKHTKEGTTEDSLQDVKSRSRGGIKDEKQLSKPGGH